MKYRFMFLIMLLSCMFARAEHSYSLWNTLDGEKDYHYTANSHIALIDGFRAEPHHGHEVLLEIDANAVFPPETGIVGGMPANNTKGVVGSIGGEVDVSSLGGAIYTIPIELPVGLGGMKPQLGVSYNSQSRNGLLGWGWDLVGLSTITRTGKTIYHDGSISAVNYNNDRFCLDGSRLMKVSPGDYGGQGTSYRTEQDQMSKIVSYRESGVNGPSFFKVWTADGNVLYYGNTADSKALMDQENHVGIWLLNRMEDRNGNFIEYHYILGQESYRLDRIEYSGNSNDLISPAFTVEFQYSDRDDKELSVVGNVFCKMDKKLDGIIVRNGASVMYAYQFNYQSPNPKNGLPYHRLAEIQFQVGEEHLNPTRIQWGDNNYNAVSGSQLKYQVTTNGITDAFINAVKFCGDFNGDGFSDVIALQPNSEGRFTTANLFVNKGLNGNLTFDFVRSFVLSQYISWVQVADFDGDGLDDILFTNRIRRNFPFPDQIEAEIYLCRMQPSGNFVFNKQVTPLCLISRDVEEAHLVGDFLGDGKSIILFQTVSGNGKGMEESRFYGYDETMGEMQLYQFNETLNSTKLFASDYDGDGVAEIFYKKHDKTTSLVKLKRNGNTFHYEEVFNETLEDWNDCFPGDFNGDGLSDVLLYTKNTEQPWKIHLSKGTKINMSGYYLPSAFPYSSPGDYHFSLDQPHHSSQHIKTGDFDGNGCSDIALYHGNLFYVFYGPLKETGDDAPFTNCQKINIQAFGLYDNMGMCLGNFLGQERLSFLGPITLSRLPSMRIRHEVKRITDGMGRKTEFDYDYLAPQINNPSDNDFYKLNATGLDHFYNTFCIAVPMRGLKKVTTYNLKDKPVETRCFYEDALLHKTGRGFLGFSKTRQEDYCNGQLQKETRKQFETEYTDHIVYLALSQEEVLDANGQLMAKSNYYNFLYSHLQNDKVFVCVTDKSSEAYDVAHPEQLVKKEICSISVATNCNQYDKYNDVISVTGQIKGTTKHPDCNLASSCEFQEITQTTYATNNTGNWLINRPINVVHTMHREGNYEDVCHKKTFYYFTNKPYLVKYTIDLPNDGSHPEDRLAMKTEFQYDVTGNIVSKTLSAPNDTLTPRQERFEYGKNFGRRLVTKQTDALGQSCRYNYDPIYNHCISITDCNGLTTRFEQDPLGITRMTYFADGTQHCKALRWDSNGYSQWEKKSGQETKVSVFAPTGELIKLKSYDINGELVLTEVEYDPLGRVSKKGIPHALGENVPSILYQYDDHGRVNKICHPDSSYEILQYGTDDKSSVFFAGDGSIQSESKTFNIMGWTVRSTDAEGHSVVYDYRSDGKPVSAQVEGYAETRIEMEYDGLGNRISLFDPNYGLSLYEFNAFNEMVCQTTPKQDKTTFHYDVLGRTVKRIEKKYPNGHQEITRWIYGMEEGQRGLLTDIVSSQQTIHYGYDAFLRLTRTTETIDGVEYRSDYSYDPVSRIASIRYPSDYTVIYNYTSEGYLNSVMDAESNLLWKTIETNALMQPTRFTTGNGFVTYCDYDAQTHRLTAIQTMAKNRVIQDYAYNYDDFANLSSRKDQKNGLEEHFSYDPLNRLTRVDDHRGTSQYSYDPLGRMISKTTPNGAVFTDADYSGMKPHAIRSLHAPQGVFPQDQLMIEYNTFNKAVSVSEGDKTIHFDYGYNHQRIRSEENIHGSVRIKTYVNGCEFVQGQDGNSVWTVLSGPAGPFAVAETCQGETMLHYIHKDHLGSWTLISDSDGNIEQETRFDAWGNCQNPDSLMFDRGFAGHEHIKGLNLINMNGRIYDPLTSSMLSPDDNIQMPDFTQNLNRYAYCLNNPLTYTDPDGNSAFETVVMFYFLYCTDFGYEFQKYSKIIALHIDLHLSNQQLGIGVDGSLGVPKECWVSYRVHGGATYYWCFYDDSYSGFEFRVGAEWCLGGCVGYSGTTFYQRKREQTTNSIILGSYLCSFSYENDYMFNIGNYVPFVPGSDNGDRYRSAAARFRFGLFSVGVNLFTGDPGLASEDRRTFNDPDVGGRETYTLNANGDDPDTYRAGVFYVGVGPFKIGANSERVRNLFQNRFAHDLLCSGNSPYFKVLDRPGRAYFYFGTGTGGTLW